MSGVKMSDDQILYCLQNLAGYEPDDIDCDDVDIAVNDDQFASMSIVRTAGLGAELIAKQQEQIELLKNKMARFVMLKKQADLPEESCTNAMYELDQLMLEYDKEALEATAKG